MNARYKMTIKTSRIDYIKFLCQNVFYHSGEKINLHPYPNIELSQHKGKEVLHYAFDTRARPFYTDLHIKWYDWSDEGKGGYIKVVPGDIRKYFTSESLAHWIIQDGYFDKSRKTVFLCTENFTKDECILLSHVLEEKLGLETVLHRRNKEKDRYRIVIKRTSIERVKDLVRKDIPQEFQYKLGHAKEDKVC